MGEYDKAIEALTSANSDVVKIEVYIRPFSLVELAEVYLALEDPTKSLECIQKTRTFKGYDFEKVLYRRILVLKDKIQGHKY